jgi:hypothetical protein
VPILEVFADRFLEDGRVVVTNNAKVGIPLGTLFTSIQSRRLIPDGEICQHEALTPAERIALSVAEIEAFRRNIEEIPKGWSSAIRLEGEGLAKLKEHLSQKTTSIFVFLATNDDAR